MSLIEEALRRAQEGGRVPRQQKPSAPPSTPAPAQPAYSSPPPTLPPRESPTASSPLVRSWIERILVIGGFVVVIGMVGWEARVYLASLKPVAATKSAASPRASGAHVVQASFHPSPRPMSLLQPHLELNGVVGGPGEPLAIINGTIMRVGEAVDGATLLEVGEDSARLRWHDQDVILRTHP